MITITTTSPAEARAAADLVASFPPGVSYQVWLDGSVVASRGEPGSDTTRGQWGTEPEMR